MISSRSTAVKARAAIIISFLLLASFDLSAMSPEESAKEMASILTENLEESPLEIEVRSLLMEGTPITSKFADKYLGLLIDRLRRNEEDFVSVKRREVSEEKVLTRGLSLSQNMSSENEEVIDATLSGTYRVSGNKIYINTRITGELGESISSAESSVLISSLSNPYMPEETTRLKEESSRLQLNKDRIRKDFKVEVDLNRGDGSLYYHGDPFKIHVMLEKEAFIRVLYRQVNGEVVTIYESDQRVSSDYFHTIPPRGSQQWEIDCRQEGVGCGTEGVIVIASTKGFRYHNNIQGSWSLTQMILNTQEKGLKTSSEVSTEFLYLTTTDR